MTPSLHHVLLLPLLLFCRGVGAFSSGARDIGTVCREMIPGHNVAPQTREAPYTVQVEPSGPFLPGATIKVTVASDAPFKGFLVTALATADNLPLGSMVLTDAANSKMVCSDGATVTHTSNQDKSRVSVNWKAPDDIYPGTEIVFRATIVQSYNTFWTKINSVKLVSKEAPTNQPPPTQPTQQGATPANLPPTQPALPSDSNSVILPPNPSPAIPATGGSDSGRPSSSSAQFQEYLQFDPECSKTKGCLHNNCNKDGCQYVITWKNTADDLLMTMTFRLPRPNLEYWIAIGYSKDQHMGDDSVTECVMEGNKVLAKQSFNEGLFNKYLDNKQAALSDITGSVVDGILHCEFTRRKKYPFDPQVFDLNNDYYLLVATGEALNGNKMPHSTPPKESERPVDLQGYENVASATLPRSVLVQVHGALMIIAWVFLTSIGITTAKYGKPMWPKCSPFGVNIWFHIHRTVMILTAVYTFIGVIIMAVECKGYCQPMEAPGQRYLPLHPPLGIFVLILTLINPIMAFFRPGPTAPNRNVFNWSHWGVGVLAWIFATITMFVGLDLQKTQAPPEAVQILVVWGVYHIVFIVLMETLPRPLAKCYDVALSSTIQRGKVYDLEKVRKVSEVQMTEPSSDGNVTSLRSLAQSDSLPADHTPTKKLLKSAEDTSREELKVKRILLLIHFCIVFAMTLALLLMLFLYTPPHGDDMGHAEHDHHHHK